MDILKIEEILHEKILEWSEIGSGMCNTVYKATTENNMYCIKVANIESDVKESNTLLVEAKITQALNLKGLLLPIPKIVYIDSNDMFYIYKFVDSTPLGEGDNDKYINTLLKDMGKFHNDLNCLSKETACNDIGIKEYTLNDFFIVYGQGFLNYSNNKNLPLDYKFVLQTALKVFRNKRENASQDQLLHNDIHGENIFLNDAGQLDCVIDFGDTVWGDIHLDLMWYVHGYPNDFTQVIDSYEKVSGKILNKPLLVSLAIMRFLPILCNWYLEGIEIIHCNEKFEDYKTLLNRYCT